MIDDNSTGRRVKIRRIALFGRPNAGKTSIFNELSGQMHKVGNWSGVTVSASSAKVTVNGHELDLVDLPGCNSLAAYSDTPIDEKITIDYLWKHSKDSLIINVVNATNIRRELYLTKQLQEIWPGPMLVVLNCMDLAIKKNIRVDIELLAKHLKVPVIPMIARNAQGIPKLQQTIQKTLLEHVSGSSNVQYPSSIVKLASNIDPAIAHNFPDFIVEGVIVRALEGDIVVTQELERLKNKDIQRSGLAHGFDIEVAKHRYDSIDKILTKVCADQVKRSPVTKQHIWVKKNLDSIFLHRMFGLPVFFLIMYVMFIFSINFGGSFQDFFDLSSQALFIALPKTVLESFSFPNWVINLVCSGIGQGINVTLTFIPVLFSMFFALAFLEQSGYMARAAFLIDKIMGYLGLPGKSFIPMIVGFGCNVPAVMGTRTLSNKSERILTIMMMPFMSCSARLAIYTVFVAAFFPNQGHNIIFALYILGILVAILTGVFLRATILHNQASKLVLELPDYQLPKISQLVQHSAFKLKKFLYKAGMFIIPLSGLLGFMGAHQEEVGAYSLLEKTGRFITPLLSPLGIEEDNWQATVALLTGMVAKEVMVGTLNSLYSNDIEVQENDNYVDLLRSAVGSIPHSLSNIKSVFQNPLAASTPEVDIHEGVLGVMHTKFQGPISAFAYLLFVLLYFPCVSVVASIAKELDNKWAAFSVVWSTTLAYLVSVSFYQIAKWHEHPKESLYWIVGAVVILGSLGVLLRALAEDDTGKLSGNLIENKLPTKIMLS